MHSSLVLSSPNDYISSATFQRQHFIGYTSATTVHQLHFNGKNLQHRFSIQLRCLRRFYRLTTETHLHSHQLHDASTPYISPRTRVRQTTSPNGPGVRPTKIDHGREDGSQTAGWAAYGQIFFFSRIDKCHCSLCVNFSCIIGQTSVWFLKIYSAATTPTTSAADETRGVSSNNQCQNPGDNATTWTDTTGARKVRRESSSNDRTTAQDQHMGP